MIQLELLSSSKILRVSEILYQPKRLIYISQKLKHLKIFCEYRKKSLTISTVHAPSLIALTKIYKIDKRKYTTHLLKNRKDFHLYFEESIELIMFWIAHSKNSCMYCEMKSSNHHIKSDISYLSFGNSLYHLDTVSGSDLFCNNNSSLDPTRNFGLLYGIPFISKYLFFGFKSSYNKNKVTNIAYNNNNILRQP